MYIMKGFDAADQRQKEKHTLISILNTYCTVVLYSPIWMNRLLFAFRACSFDHGQNRSKSMFIWKSRETKSGKNYVLKVVPYRLITYETARAWLDSSALENRSLKNDLKQLKTKTILVDS